MSLPHRTAKDETLGSSYVEWALVVESCNNLEPIDANLSEDKINEYRRQIDRIAEVAVEDPKMAISESGLEPNHIPTPYRQRRLSPLITMGVGECIMIRKLTERAEYMVGFAGRLLFDRSRSDSTRHKLTDVSHLQGMRRYAETGLERGGQLTWRHSMFEK